MIKCISALAAKVSESHVDTAKMSGVWEGSGPVGVSGKAMSSSADMGGASGGGSCCGWKPSHSSFFYASVSATHSDMGCVPWRATRNSSAFHLNMWRVVSIGLLRGEHRACNMGWRKQTRAIHDKRSNMPLPVINHR